MVDTKEIINCPACGKPMEKIYIPSEKINIDICTDGCGGIFFDNREFDKFNEENEDISAIMEKYKNKTYTPANETETRKCPVCGAKMVRNKSAVKGNIVVDDCYNCGGKFLDYGELNKIRTEFPTDAERSEAALDLFMQKKGEQLALENMKMHNKGRSLSKELIYILTGIDL